MIEEYSGFYKFLVETSKKILQERGEYTPMVFFLKKGKQPQTYFVPPPSDIRAAIGAILTGMANVMPLAFRDDEQKYALCNIVRALLRARKDIDAYCIINEGWMAQMSKVDAKNPMGEWVRPSTLPEYKRKEALILTMATREGERMMTILEMKRGFGFNSIDKQEEISFGDEQVLRSNKDEKTVAGLFAELFE